MTAKAKPAEPVIAPDAATIKTSIETIQTTIIKFDKIDAGLAELELAHPKDIACDVTTPAGMRQAVAGRAAWRDPRIELEKVRKTIKAPILALGRSIDAFAEQLKDKLIEGETHYGAQIDVENKRKEDERQAKLQIEADRIAAIRALIVKSFTLPATEARGKSSAVIDATVASIMAVSLKDFGDLSLEATTGRDDALAALALELQLAVDREFEADRVKREREELDAQRAIDATRRAEEAAANERIKAELKAQQDAIDLRRAEEAAQAARERAAAQVIQDAALAKIAEAQAVVDAAIAATRADIATANAEIERLREIAEAEEKKRLEEAQAEQQRIAQAEAGRIAREQEAKTRVEKAAPLMLTVLMAWQTYDSIPEDERQHGLLEVTREMRDDAIKLATEKQCEN